MMSLHRGCEQRLRSTGTGENAFNFRKEREAAMRNSGADVLNMAGPS